MSIFLPPTIIIYRKGVRVHSLKSTIITATSSVVVGLRFPSCHHPPPSRKFANVSRLLKRSKPAGSEVLTCHLENNGCPPWTSYFVRYDSIVDDQWGKSHFNWPVAGGAHNYHILRTGCYPYIKYHCSKRPHQDLKFDDAFFRFIKVFNLGLPCLAYGIAAIFMIRHTETVITSKGPVTIYFLYEENKGSSF